MKEDNTPTVTPRRRTPSAKMRLRLETAKRIKAVNSKHKSARARKKEAKRNACETDPEAHVLTTAVPRIKKNRLADPPKATSKFKKRQIHKTWLPTHLWHAKRAHMTRPSEPLWRMAIPLSPTEKSYRPTHRASGGRGAIAWDMSYMATIGCQGVEAPLIAMLRGIGFGDDNARGTKGKKWMKGMRSLSGWAYERDNEKRLIGPITVLWGAECRNSTTDTSKNPAVNSMRNEVCAGVVKPDAAAGSKKDKPMKRKVLLRVHPSAFHQLWTELVKVAKWQHPPVMLEDLRFEIASIDVIGPGSTEALCAVLQPKGSSDGQIHCSVQTWTKLPCLTNAASLPLGATLGFDVSDPRLTHPRKSIAIKTDESSNDEVTDLIVEWPLDNAPLECNIFSHKARRTTSTSLPSQKAIDRRKSLSLPGEGPTLKDTDPQIPVLLLASRPSPSANTAQGTWTVLLPWKCLVPIWRCLMYYPLSSGGTARFGGLDETRQIAFERNEPWFPGDFPGTEAGIAWERSESEKRQDVWKRKPASRRVNYEALKLGSEAKGEHGRGWACDWEFLLALSKAEANVRSSEEEPHESSNMSTSSNILSTENGRATDTGTVESNGPIESTDQEQTSSPALATSFTQLSPLKASTLLNRTSHTILPTLPDNPLLATIRLTLLSRGNASPCARIYRLPSSTASACNPSFRSKWLALDPRSHSSIKSLQSKKIKTNHHGDPAVHTAYGDEYEDLSAINYRPPDMVPEAIEEMEKKRGEVGMKRERFWREKLARKIRERETEKEKEGVSGIEGGEGVEVEGMTAEVREELMGELMRPSADRAEAGPECPGPGDLIGFVSSGGYNLSVGRGTGVGSVWVQRVLEGWEAQREGAGQTGRQGGVREGKRPAIGREERLCVVRNAGERVGRLAVWELCD